ncbi:LON peptidase substrate-binding domain-containing protein, partial [Candidatus Poribacteria bacterium]|nr:LON peptidase substrate-binding domain-containing protein [Candidatus Poribacteria bacterium]
MMKSKPEDEQTLNADIPEELPIILLRDDLVIFPYMPPVPPFSPYHIALSGKAVAAAVDEAMINTARLICIFKEWKDTKTDDLTVEDFSPVGTLIYIIKYRKDDENVLFLAQGRARIQIEDIIQTNPFIKARVRLIEEEEKDSAVEMEALIRSTVNLFQKIVKLSSKYPEELGIIADNIDEPGRLADYIASILDFKSADKQLILETVPAKERLDQLIVMLTKELNLLELESKIQSDAQAVISKG